jgi:hypothetical protein
VYAFLTALARVRSARTLIKCAFASRKVQYLGFVVGENGLEVDETKTEAVQRAVPPGNKTELRRFLGMTGFYQNFIPSYAKVAAP